LQPADLLKTRVQQSTQTASLSTTIRGILASPHPIRSLWRGTIPSALRTGFGSALYFTSLIALRQGVAQRGPAAIVLADLGAGGGGNKTYSSSALPQLSHTANLVTGAIARTAAGFVMMPVTVLKVRFESDYYAYRSLVGAARDIVRTEGPKGLFTGFGATAVRDAPYAGLYVVFYEHFKRNLSGMIGAGTTTINFASGALAAGLATALTNPFDAVKTRIQLRPDKYRNMLHAVRLMVTEDGVRSLLSGLGLRMGRKALSSALAWTVYEELILRAERRWSDQDGMGL
jgi:solute carrier family 25 protein 38